MIGIVILDSVDNYNSLLIIHANNKHSAWYFYLSYNVNMHVL